MDEETWKKGEDLIKKMSELKTNSRVQWSERRVGDSFMLFCTLLKENAIPTKELDLSSDEKKKWWKNDNENDM